jgi:hypothetical protein
MYACLKLLAMVTGTQYRKHKEFSVVKVLPVSTLFLQQLRFKRFFVSINVNNRERILSGVYEHLPTSILAYVDIFGKMKIFSPGILLSKFVQVLVSLIVLAILKFFLL